MVILEKDLNGIVLPTRRNADIIQSIFDINKDFDKVAEIVGKDYFAWVKATMFDPRKETVFFSSPQAAQKASERIAMVNALDEIYAAEH